MPLPTDRQRNDFYLALARLTTSCQEANTEAAIAACEDLIHDARGILAGLYERDPDASSSSEDSHGDADGDAGGEDGDDGNEGDCDGSDASEDDSQGDDDEEEVSSASDAESSSSDDSQGDANAADSSGGENSEPDDLVPDYAGILHPARHCDRCDVYGHTNQYCPFLPAPKRRRV